MKILAINGSPRIGGNTDILVEEVLKGAVASGAEIEKIVLSGLDIAPCQESEYEKVSDSGRSVIDDDLQLVVDKIEESDVIVLASPIFFGSLSAQTKIMIDRFQFVWISKNKLGREIFDKKRYGGFVCVSAAQREDFYNNARSIARHFFATINVECKEELFCPGVDKKGAVLERKEYLEQAYEMGKRLSGD